MSRHTRTRADKRDKCKKKHKSSETSGGGVKHGEKHARNRVKTNPGEVERLLRNTDQGYDVMESHWKPK